ncbi:MAG: 50S ribosomal protein L24 [Rhodospirillaceae bacterium]|nr:50S ribosomal protein L24 [Rhodospirillaceae bacterium]
MKIRKGDRVTVISGRDKGKSGQVLRVLRAEGRVIVQGVNMVTRHARQTPRSPGGLIEKEAAIHVSNVALIDPKSGRPTRVGYKTLEDGRKVRVARRSGEMID